MNLLNLLDPELGAKVRAVIAVALGVITAVVAVLQAVAGVLDTLPRWQGVGAVAIWIQSALVFLARFTPVGTVTPKE
jgi:hypothetical protein